MNRTALITGASGGIGLELTKIFAKEKYSLVLLARREEKLKEIAKELHEKYHINIFVLSKDLSDPNSPKEIKKELKENNIQIDILVNNAGFGNAGKFVKNDIEKELNMIQVNIASLTELTHLFLPEMIKNKYGKILNVASTAAFQPVPMLNAYSATKSYVLHFTEALGNELIGTGVTTTALCPGPTPTNFAIRSKLGEIGSDKAPGAKEVAEAGYTALMKGKPVIVVGIKNKFMTFLTKITPRSLVVKITGKLMQK